PGGTVTALGRPGVPGRPDIREERRFRAPRGLLGTRMGPLWVRSAPPAMCTVPPGGTIVRVRGVFPGVRARDGPVGDRSRAWLITGPLPHVLGGPRERRRAWTCSTSCCC